jgi:hypothetical protein
VGDGAFESREILSREPRRAKLPSLHQYYLASRFPISISQVGMLGLIKDFRASLVA